MDDHPPNAQEQHFRVLEGRFVLTRARDTPSVAVDADLLAFVAGPDGGASMRRDDGAEDAWAALWNGDDAHDPEATGMLSAIVAPLAAGGIPVWTAASYDGDLVLVPVSRLSEAVEVLQQVGHRVGGDLQETARGKTSTTTRSYGAGHDSTR